MPDVLGIPASRSSRRQSIIGPLCRSVVLFYGGAARLFDAKLHKRLHTHCTFDEEQVVLNGKAPTCGAFAEPSDGLEPSTRSLPCGLGRLASVADGCHRLRPLGSINAPGSHARLAAIWTIGPLDHNRARCRA